MADDGHHRLGLVDVDDAQARVVGRERDDDHGDAAVEQLPGDRRALRHGGEDDSVHTAADERPHLVGLGVAVVFRSRYDDGEPVMVCPPLDLARDRRVEGVQDVGHDDAQRLGRAALERSRDLVRPVAELVDGVEHARPGAVGDRDGAGDDVRHGRHRDAGAAGDVVHRDAHAAASTRWQARRSVASDVSTPSSGVMRGSSCSIEMTPSYPAARSARTSAVHVSSSWPVPTAREVPRGRVGVDREAQVEQAVPAHAIGVDERVLAVGEPDRRPDLLDDGDRVHPLPPEVARVEVHAHVRAGRLAEPRKRRRVVGRGTCVELEADHHAGGDVGRPGRELTPERRQAVLQLPLPERLVVGDDGPGREDRRRAAAAAAGAAAHRDDPVAAEERRQLDGAAEQGGVALADGADRGGAGSRRRSRRRARSPWSRSSPASRSRSPASRSRASRSRWSACFQPPTPISMWRMSRSAHQRSASTRDR